MNRNLWIKKTLGIASAITLMVWLITLSSPVKAASQAGAPTANVQTAVPGDEKWSGQFALGADGWVYATALAPNGDLYIAGEFTHVAGIQAYGVAKWSASTNQWSSLGSGVNSAATALAFSDNTLYIGGGFTQAGGAPASAIASYGVNTGTWSNLGGGMAHATTNPEVGTLVFDSGGNLYAGGRFDSAGGVVAQNVAMWNGSSWSAMGSGLGTTDDVVSALAANINGLFAGGSFSSPAGNLAQWTGSAWTTLGGGTNDQVLDLAITASSLYVGGFFTTVNGGALTVNHVAMIDILTSGWSTLGSGLTGSWAGAIAIDGNDNVYVTGAFTQAGGSPANNVAMWDGTTWSILKNPTGLTDGLDSDGFSLAINGSDVYIGGRFSLAEGTYAASSLVRWNALDQQFYSPGNSVNGPVYALAISGSEVYVGGDFTSAGGLTARSIARWNSANNTWYPVSPDQLSGCNGTCPGPVVSAIAVNESDVYVGGNFTNAGGIVVNNIARLNGTTWSAMSGGVTGCTPPFCAVTVYALLADGSGVDVGGMFNDAGATTVNNVAWWDGANWHAFTDVGNTNTGTNGTVYSIAYDGGYYFGGNFTSPYMDLVYFDGANWFVGWSALNAPVLAIVPSGSDLYIGGEFTNAGGSGANYVAVSRHGSDWQPLGDSLDNEVFSMAMRGSSLFVGGYFTHSGLSEMDHIASWDTVSSSWRSLGSGADQSVYALALDQNFINVGGLFHNAGGKPSQLFGRYGSINLFLPLTMK